MKKEKRLGSWLDHSYGAWLWSLRLSRRRARERSSSRKRNMASASLCSQKREKGLFI